MNNWRKGVIMLHLPNPVLNEEEMALLDDAPESCLQQAVQRGALSVDEITENLSPRVAAAVQRIASGERPPTRSGPVAPPQSPDAGMGLGERLFRALKGGDDAPAPPAPPPAPEGPGGGEADWIRRALTPFAELIELLDEQNLTPSEALAAANAIDRALGRYMTGTRYAAP
jgi:hypothetical protein